MELVGFVRRVLPKVPRSSGANLPSMIPTSLKGSTESLVDDARSSIGKLPRDGRPRNVNPEHLIFQGQERCNFEMCFKYLNNIPRNRL